MPADDKMTIDERRKYVVRMQKRYREADRRIREQLLEEMQQMTQLHRKSLIRLMAGNLERQPRRQQRGRTYGRAVERAVQIIAESLDYPCAERLTPNLVWMANHLVRQGELQVTPEVLAQVGEISLSTVQRLSADWRRDIPRRLPRGGHERVDVRGDMIPLELVVLREQGAARPLQGRIGDDDFHSESNTLAKAPCRCKGQCFRGYYDSP